MSIFICMQGEVTLHLSWLQFCQCNGYELGHLSAEEDLEVHPHPKTVTVTFPKFSSITNLTSTPSFVLGYCQESHVSQQQLEYIGKRPSSITTSTDISPCRWHSVQSWLRSKGVISRELNPWEWGVRSAPCSVTGEGQFSYSCQVFE